MLLCMGDLGLRWQHCMGIHRVCCLQGLHLRALRHSEPRGRVRMGERMYMGGMKRLYHLVLLLELMCLPLLPHDLFRLLLQFHRYLRWCQVPMVRLQRWVGIRTSRILSRNTEGLCSKHCRCSSRIFRGYHRWDKPRPRLYLKCSNAHSISCIPWINTIRC